MLHELSAAERPPRVGHQEREQVELAGGQREFRSVARSDPRGRVEGDRPGGQLPPGCGRVAGAAQHRFDSQDQLTRRKGLGDVVVGADLEAGDALVGLAERGQHDDRQVRMLGAHSPAHFEPVDLGQHQVEHHQVGPVGGNGFKRLASVGHVQGPVTGAFQIADDHSGNGQIVVDDEHLGHVPSLGSRAW